MDIARLPGSETVVPGNLWRRTAALSTRTKKPTGGAFDGIVIGMTTLPCGATPANPVIHLGANCRGPIRCRSKQQKPKPDDRQRTAKSKLIDNMQVTDVTLPRP